jgi:hypothetical protein
MQHLLKFVDYFSFFDFDFRLKIIQLLANMLQNQEEIIVKKQEQVATMDTAERRMKELRSFIFNNE